MSLKKLFKKRESLVSVDIGASGIKLLELDTRGSRPKLLNIGFASIEEEVFNGQVCVKPDRVSEQITALLDANSIKNKRAVVAMPAPGVFTKRIKTAKVDPAELASAIEFEAGNLIPHSLDTVRLDYHVIGEVENDQIEVLVVAVKNEIIDSFIECISLSGVETAVVDVDYFAMQNIFELGYSDKMDKVNALVNVGSRYTSVNICRGGDSLFGGEIGVGGHSFTEGIMEGLGLDEIEAEKVKKNPETVPPAADGSDQKAVLAEIMATRLDQVVAEIGSQLEFFWSACGIEGSIDCIYLCGGGSLTPQLAEKLAAQTSVPCEILDPFKGIDVGNEIDDEYLKQLGPVMAVCAGMGIREPGDKVLPDY